jgi:hypothetical protein
MPPLNKMIIYLKDLWFLIGQQPTVKSSHIRWNTLRILDFFSKHNATTTKMWKWRHTPCVYFRFESANFAACIFLYRFQFFVHVCARKCSVILAEYVRIFWRFSMNIQQALLPYTYFTEFYRIIRTKRKSWRYCSPVKHVGFYLI